MSTSPRLRIAVLNRHFGYRFGGAERYAAAIAEELSDTHEVHVFAQDIEHHHPGITYHPVSRPFNKPRWLNQLWFALQTWRLTRHGFDVVHSHENTWHGDLQTVHVRPFRVGLFHGLSPARRALRWLSLFTSPRLITYWWLEAARLSVNPGRRIVATSDQVKRDTLMGYPHTASMLEVIPPGVNMPAKRLTTSPARAQLQLPLDVPLALFVGNDFDKKGLSALLQALALTPGLHVAVVGQGRHLQRYREQIANLGLADRVHLLGSLSDVTPAYAAADWLVHPTTEDTYAMVVLEAMASGLPVIVSSARFCGIAAELTHTVNALILDDPRDEEQLSERLLSLLEDPSLRESLARAGLSFAQERTWRQAAAQHEALIQRVLAQRPGD
ncbi:MAG: glycosyltransferase family 4 protein [Limnohabitans sp.]